MNNSGSGTSTIVARHDYLPYGEEIWAGVGLRTTTQKYATTDKVRQRYAMTERDEASGLDHTPFRKYDSFAGRWTGPDPLRKGVGNPQDLNGYHYTQNDPVNRADPTGLLCFEMTVGSDGEGNFFTQCVWFGDSDPFNGFVPKDRVPGDPQGKPPKGTINVNITLNPCGKGSPLLTINGNAIERTENGASIKLDGPAAFFFGLVASDQAGRDISLKANTVISLNLTANNGYAISSNPSVSIGFFGPNVSVGSVQFNSSGAVTGVEAKYLGFRQPVSSVVKDQVNSALAATFGTGQGINSDVVQSLLNTARDNPTGNCISATISPATKP
jgi:RHS repeat-associated protein